jgi:hypothetical protein
MYSAGAACYVFVVRRSAVLLCAVAASSALFACGLTADFSGLQGGTRAGPDATLVVDASGLPDVSDASGPVSDGSDAGDLGDAGAVGDAGPGFCASLTTSVKLCSDFDEGKPVETGWTAADVSGGAAISISAPAFSGPGSFLSAINPSGAPSSARLEETLPTQSPHVHVEFEMLLVPTDGQLELAVIHEVTKDGTTYGLYYREVASVLQVQLRSLAADGGVYDQSWPIGAPPAGWVRVDLDMDLGEGDAGSFTVYHDGGVVVSQTNVPTSTPSRAAMFVELGFYSFTPASGQANFDNAIVDWP